MAHRRLDAAGESGEGGGRAKFEAAAAKRKRQVLADAVDQGAAEGIVTEGSIEAVSYTHLDVYKRQSQACALTDDCVVHDDAVLDLHVLFDDHLAS